MNPHDDRTTPITDSATRLGRRRFVALTAASTAAVAADMATTPRAHAAPATPPHDGSRAAAALRFAMITDTHINVDLPDRTASLRQVMDDLAARQPDAVLHCGDITDHGGQDEFALYNSCVPASLAPLIHYVPGNHEEQWNADAWEAYRHTFGPTRYSFDLHGVHFLAMDPLSPQEWQPYHVSAELVDFIRSDLRRVSRSTPVILFNHFPLDQQHFLALNNAEEIWCAIEGHNVRVIFGGHIHRRDIRNFNGLTQIIGAAGKSGPVYYWAQGTEDGRHLTVAEVTLDADNTRSETPVATIPLTTASSSADLLPLATHVAVDGRTARVEARTPTNPPVSHVEARVWPRGQEEAAEPWRPMKRRSVRRGRALWSTDLDLSAHAPGSHRVQIRDGGTGEAAFEFGSDITPLPSKPGRQSPRVAWRRHLHQRVSGALAQHGNTVVVATESGTVEALDVTRRGAETAWRRRLGGGVFRGAVLAPDHASFIVNCADHHVYALDRHNGRINWQVDLGAPVMSETHVVGEGDDSRLVMAAGTSLFCLDPEGAVQWKADLGGNFTGLAGSDDDHVYAASTAASFTAAAFRLSSGKRVWTNDLFTGHTSFERVVYVPSTIQALPSGNIMFTSTHGPAALDPATGAVQWNAEGPDFYNTCWVRPTLTHRGLLLFNGGNAATTALIDPDDGHLIWSDDTIVTNYGSGLVASPDRDVYWLPSNNGLLVEIDLGARTVTPLLQISISFIQSAGLAVPAGGGTSLLVVADKLGTVSAVSRL